VGQRQVSGVKQQGGSIVKRVVEAEGAYAQKKNGKIFTNPAIMSFQCVSPDCRVSRVQTCSLQSSRMNTETHSTTHLKTRRVVAFCVSICSDMPSRTRSHIDANSTRLDRSSSSTRSPSRVTTRVGLGSTATLELRPSRFSRATLDAVILFLAALHISLEKL
jgi:hypothetical protein